MNSKNNKTKHLEKYEILSGIYILIFSFIIIYIINNIFGFYDSYKIYLDNLYSYEYFLNLISKNTKYFLGIILIYLIFLGYIKEKKGIIFGTVGKSNINIKYGNIFLLLNRLINFLSIFFICYLYKIGKINELILIISGNLLILYTLYLMQEYIKIRSDHKSLEKIVNSIKIKEENMILKIFTGAYVEYLIGTTFTLAFLIIPLGMKLNFNLITIFIIHFQFIFIYMGLNLLSNKFPGIVSVKFNEKIKKGFLIENTKDKIILMTEKENYILNPDKIEYIKEKKK